MKIRQGFVSNSSSSSFMIATSNIEGDCKIAVTITVDLAESCTIINTEEELRAYFRKTHDYIPEVDSNDDLKGYAKKMYDEFLAKIREGKTLLKGKVSSERSEVSAYLYDHGISQFVKNNPNLEFVKQWC